MFYRLKRFCKVRISIFSASGIITFKTAELQNTFSTIPLDRLLIETDSPYLFSTKSVKKQPSFIKFTAEKLVKKINNEFN